VEESAEEEEVAPDFPDKEEAAFPECTDAGAGINRGVAPGGRTLSKSGVGTKFGPLRSRSAFKAL